MKQSVFQVLVKNARVLTTTVVPNKKERSHKFERLSRSVESLFVQVQAEWNDLNGRREPETTTTSVGFKLRIGNGITGTEEATPGSRTCHAVANLAH
jgi:hypothetical protein